ENEAKGKLSISNQSGTPKYQLRRSFRLFSQAVISARRCWPPAKSGYWRSFFQPMWRLSGRNHDPSRLPTHGWIGFETTTI
ncbi:hypothetical protein M513_07181, partial [Trichuris suis]